MVCQIDIPMHYQAIQNRKVRLECVLYSSVKRHTLLSVFGSVFSRLFGILSAFDSEFNFAPMDRKGLVTTITR